MNRFWLVHEYGVNAIHSGRPKSSKIQAVTEKKVAAESDFFASLDWSPFTINKKAYSMIARIWHGWTTPSDADHYESLLKAEIFVGIQRRSISGFAAKQT